MMIAVDSLIANLRARNYICELGSDRDLYYVYLEGYGTYQFIFTTVQENVIRAEIDRVSKIKIEDYFQTDIDSMF